MHYADFAEDDVSSLSAHGSTSLLIQDGQSAALLAAIKDYETNKWKVIGSKVGKPAKVRFPASKYLL